MKLGFRSLICQLFSPTPVFKEASEYEKVFWPVPSEYKRRLNFSNQSQTSSLHSLLGAWRKRKRKGICNGQFLTPRLRHASHLIRNSRRQITGYAKQSNPKSIAQLFLRSLLLLRNQPRGHSSFRGIHYPGDVPPSESITTLRLIFFVLSKTATSTNLIDSRL